MVRERASRRSRTGSEATGSGDDGAGAAEPGVVYLVGAGPGGPDLITVRGQRLLSTADAVVVDELADPGLLALARCELTVVGKRGGNKAGSTPQGDINELLISLAIAGKSVVRLKGGDPLVFGRVQQEIDALDAAGVVWQIVPGVTSALSAAAAVGVPVTDKEESKAFVVLSGHDPSIHDWAAVGAVDTAVILMGTRKLRDIADALLRAGKPPSTPVAVVSWANTPKQRLIKATLDSVADAADAASPPPLSPAIVIVGAVARHARQ